jgi:phosphoglycolate phosphatase-like HAD superfamily hydrolase
MTTPEAGDGVLFASHFVWMIRCHCTLDCSAHAQLQGADIDQAAFIRFKRDWYLSQINMVRPVEPVLAIAREAQRRGIPMAIASGGGREHVVGAIAANGLRPMFAAFVCAEVPVTSIRLCFSVQPTADAVADAAAALSNPMSLVNTPGDGRPPS